MQAGIVCSASHTHDHIPTRTPRLSQQTDAYQPPLAYPWSKIARLAFLWLAFLTLKVLESTTTRCTWPYAAAMAAQVALCLGCALLFASEVHREHGEASEPLLDDGSDLHFDRRVVMHAALGTCTAGVIAGLLGLGGGAWGKRLLPNSWKIDMDQ